MSTGLAAVLWSRLTTLDSAHNRHHLSPFSRFKYEPDLTYEGLGPIYPVDDDAKYIRPTLRKAPLLFFVLAVQPILTVTAVILIALLSSKPISRGFGLASIPAGINHKSLGMLEGATLSGKLTKDVGLSIYPIHDGETSARQYDVCLPSTVSQRRNILSLHRAYN